MIIISHHFGLLSGDKLGRRALPCFQKDLSAVSDPTWPNDPFALCVLLSLERHILYLPKLYTEIK